MTTAIPDNGLYSVLSSYTVRRRMHIRYVAYFMWRKCRSDYIIYTLFLAPKISTAVRSTTSAVSNSCASYLSYLLLDYSYCVNIQCIQRLSGPYESMRAKLVELWTLKLRVSRTFLHDRQIFRPETFHVCEALNGFVDWLQTGFHRSAHHLPAATWVVGACWLQLSTSIRLRWRHQKIWR